jgi:hypothetical protein
MSQRLCDEASVACGDEELSAPFDKFFLFSSRTAAPVVSARDC